MQAKSVTAALPDGMLVPNKWIRHAQSDTLTLILPGMGYTSLGPVLHYPRLWALERGSDVLSVDYHFDTVPPADNAVDYAMACALAVWNAVKSSATYEKFIVIGKSIGTQAMARVLDSEPLLRASPCIWLTPIFADDVLMDVIARHRPPSLFVAGTADATYIAPQMQTAVTLTQGQHLVIDDANHSLELERNVRASAAVIPRLLDALDQFQPTE